MFTQRNFVADIIRLKLNFILKPKIEFWATLWGLMGNVRTPSTHSSLQNSWSTSYSSYYWTFFAIFYGWDVISGNLSMSGFSEGVGHFERIFQAEGASPTNQCWCQKTRVHDCLFVWYQNIRCALFSFVTKHALDGRTDRQTKERQSARMSEIKNGGLDPLWQSVKT